MKRLSNIILTITVLMILVVVGSWMLAVSFPSLQLHSMLSEEGIRWFVGHFSEIIASRFLACLLLASFAFGILRECGIKDVLDVLRSPQLLSYRQRLGLHVTTILLAVCLLLVGYLAMIPHAVLRGATGKLWPSAFADGLLPLICGVVMLLAIVYGCVSRTFRSVESIIVALCRGVSRFAPLFLLYVLLVQLFYCIVFVLTPAAT